MRSVGGRFHDVLDPAEACHGFVQRDNQIGKLDQLHQDLRHIIIEGNQLSLRQDTGGNVEGAATDQKNDGKVDDDVSKRIHQRRDPSGKELNGGKTAVQTVEIGHFLFFFVESTDDTGAVVVATHFSEHPVKA